MTDKKTDTMQRDASATTPSVRNRAGRPGEEPPRSGKGVGLSFDALLGHVSGAEERQAQSLLQEQPNPTAGPDSSEHAIRTVPSATVSGQGIAKGRSRDKVHAGAVAALSRRQPKARTLREGPGAVRQKVMMGLIPVLAIALVFMVRNPLKVSAVPPGQDTQPAVAARATGAEIEIDWKIPPLYLPGDRDPMRLPQAPAPPEVEAAGDPVTPAQARLVLTVSGILFSQDRPAAIVDTHLVHEGEQVAGATVKKIGMNSVEFEMNGRTWKQAVDKHE